MIFFSIAVCSLIILSEIFCKNTWATSYMASFKEDIVHSSGTLSNVLPGVTFVLWEQNFKHIIYQQSELAECEWTRRACNQNQLTGSAVFAVPAHLQSISSRCCMTPRRIQSLSHKYWKETLHHSVTFQNFKQSKSWHFYLCKDWSCSLFNQLASKALNCSKAGVWTKRHYCVLRQ